MSSKVDFRGGGGGGEKKVLRKKNRPKTHFWHSIHKKKTGFAHNRFETTLETTLRGGIQLPIFPLPPEFYVWG